MAGLPTNNNSRALQQLYSLFEERGGEHSAHALAHWQQALRLGWPTRKHETWNYTPLEGLLEQQTGLNPTEIMTDTAGSSDLIFGLFWLLGYQFSPRLADAGASVFWRVDKDADYGVLNDIARNAANARKIEQHWDDMMRMAGSLTLGTIRASVLIRSLLNSDRPSGLTQVDWPPESPDSWYHLS